MTPMCETFPNFVYHKLQFLGKDDVDTYRDTKIWRDLT